MQWNLTKLLQFIKSVKEKPKLPLAQRYGNHSLGLDSYGDIKVIDTKTKSGSYS